MRRIGGGRGGSIEIFIYIAEIIVRSYYRSYVSAID